MTVLVALHEAGIGTWIASDRRANFAQALVLDCAQKWIPLSDSWWAGVCGDSRALDLLAGENRWDGLSNPYDFTERVRAMFQDQGWKRKDDDRGAADWGTAFILANAQGAWEVDCSLAITDVTDVGLWAAGSGRDLALGCGFATRDWPADKRVEAAVLAACAFNNGCGGMPWVELLRAP